MALVTDPLRSHVSFCSLQDHPVLMSLGQDDASLASTTLKVCAQSRNAPRFRQHCRASAGHPRR